MIEDFDHFHRVLIIGPSFQESVLQRLRDGNVEVVEVMELPETLTIDNLESLADVHLRYDFPCERQCQLYVKPGNKRVMRPKASKKKRGK